MERIGRFKILKRLGSGGFGEVWLGHDEVIKREVAIKIFKPKDENLIAFATSTNTEGLDVLRARFLSEAQVLGSLEHNPYVINVLDFGELDDGSPYYVMPFLPNSLTDRLGKDIYDAAAIEELPEAERPRALSQEAALKWLDQLLQGLAAAHDKHLVHRDIKPSNIMLTDSGEARLVDFGIAKAPDGPHSTVSQLGMGSRNYMAPEQRESAKHVDARADIYAVGVVAYRMLTGRLPAGRFSDPNVHVPSLTQPISDLIVACLAEDKLERPENAAVLLKQLRAAAEGQATGEETGTWVASSNSSLRDELRPLKNEITQLLENDAEIDQSDRVRLEAMAAVAGLDPDGLQALIEQVEQEQGPVLQARQNFLRVIRDNSDSGDGIDRDMLHKVSAATGWSADKVDRVIDRQTKTDSVTAAVKPRSALRKVGRTLVVGIVVGIVALAGFWVWDTGQQRAQEEKIRTLYEANRAHFDGQGISFDAVLSDFNSRTDENKTELLANIDSSLNQRPAVRAQEEYRTAEKAKAEAIIAKLTPKCATPTLKGDPACWLKVANQQQCYIWRPTPQSHTSVTWSGTCQNAQVTGRGTETWSDDGGEGVVRTGSYVDGVQHGQWELRDANGAVFTGPYVDGKQHGQWEIRDADGNVWTGPYVDGKLHGRWEWRQADGDVWTGPYVDGVLHGRWEWRWADGTVEYVQYVNGEIQ